MQAFHCPTKIYFGEGALGVLSEYHVKRILLVTDPFFVKSGTVADLKAYVPEAEVRVFDKVVPDPSLALAAEGAAVCETFRPDMLLALGGGSAMDCAKGIYAAAGRDLVFVAIPTTSGSGSEVTSYSILTHEGAKHPLVDAELRPSAAILDARFLYQMPRALVADTGMDLLAHAMEAIGSVSRNLFTDALAFQAAETALDKLALSFSGERSARLLVHEAATMAGMAFDQAGLGVCHALAHAIGGVFHIPHGKLCTMLLPAVMTFNAPEAMGQYVKLARRCGLNGATERLLFRGLLQEIERLRKTLRQPGNLSQAGVTKEQWNTNREKLLQNALMDPCCRTNPVQVTRAGLETICKAVEP